MALSTDPVITTLGIVQFGTDLPTHSSIYNFFKDETIVHLSCGTQHSAVVCKSGRVATFGKNQSNFWLEVDNNTLAEPTFVTALESIRIIQAACGVGFTYFLTDTGELYSSGCNDDGQLGLGHKNKCRLPVKVIQIPAIKKVTAGSGGYHVVALTNTGEVWVAGWNENGQLGLGHKESQTSFIHSSNVNEPITDISCGYLFTALLSASGVLMMSGSNEYGQLGLTGNTSILSFQPVSLPSTVVSVACGFYHTVALTVNGSAWAWGFNYDGQLGVGNKTNFSTPQIMVGLQSHTISKVVAGTRHTALLTEEGNVLVCGRGDSGELGLPKQPCLVATLLPKSAGFVVKEVAFAAFYTLMLVTPKPKYEPVKISDVEKIIMKSLECSICFKMMCAPIRHCAKGHNVCGPCWTRSTDCSICFNPSVIEARCSALESLSALLHLPCTDCLERIPLSLLQKHGKVCLKRQYSCPVQPELCIWRGFPETMLTHVTAEHNDQVVQKLPRLFPVNMTSDETLADVLAVHDEIFILHRRYNKMENIFHAAMRYIGAAENLPKYKFEIEFIGDSDISSTSFRKDICADTGTIEEMFQSDNCVCIQYEQLATFLQDDKLVCQVSVVRVQSGDRADLIKALLSA